MPHTVKFKTKQGKLLRTYTVSSKTIPNKFFWEKIKAEQRTKVSKDHDILAEHLVEEEIVTDK